MTLPDWLTQGPDGYICVTGHRVGLEDAVHFYNQGDSPEMLHCRFPTVALPTFYKVIAFYLENKEEIDRICAANAARVAQQRNASQSGPSLDELRRRREARRLPQGA